MRYNLLYMHDGNKNVSDLVSYQTARGVPAHYEYAPFGELTVSTTNTAFTTFNVAKTNPYRFSSEYADDTLGLVYYNYRHYNPTEGRWIQRDFRGDYAYSNLYGMCKNSPIKYYDILGLDWKFIVEKGEVFDSYEVEKKDRKCCEKVRIDRYVRKFLGCPGAMGDFELDHACFKNMSTSYSDERFVGRAETDHPDGPGGLLFNLLWTFEFRWVAVCIEGEWKDRIISQTEKKFKTEFHFSWEVSEEGYFMPDEISYPRIEQAPYEPPVLFVLPLL